MLGLDAPMPEKDAHDSLILRVEISAEQVDAVAPRLRDALTAAADEGSLTRRELAVAEREERLRTEQAELEDRAQRLAEQEAELRAARQREEEFMSSDRLTASERIRFAHRHHVVELPPELETRENDLLVREAEFEADVLLREERIERWRSELNELKDRLDRRERDLATYVDQLQDTLAGGSRLPSPPGVTELRRSA
jgi:DNA repair exonuclease SbcCD ATPase subunit